MDEIEQCIQITHCFICDTEFDVRKKQKHHPAKDHGYDGMVCRWCLHTTIRNRQRDYRDRARKVKTFGNLTRKQIFQAFVENSFSCKDCGVICDFKHRSKRQLTIDHVYPLSLGGMNIKENITVLCTHCHRKKDNYKGPKLCLDLLQPIELDLYSLDG